MTRTISIDPISRIEGHLAIRVDVESDKVTQAYCQGEMFRGFEIILKGRDPLDAQQITQRICGVCPVSHGMASILAQDQAYGITPPKNGRLARNLILGANYIQSHIVHFYHLSALDFVDIAAIVRYKGNDPTLNYLKHWVTEQLKARTIFPAVPFLPRYDGDYIQDTELNIIAIKHYLEAFNMRALAQRAAVIFCGKLPHAAALVPGGVTEKITAHKIAEYRSVIKTLQTFIDHAYLPDVIHVAGAFPDYFDMGKGCENFLAYGVFQESSSGNTFFPGGVTIKGDMQMLDADRITEDIRFSLFNSPSGLHPNKGQTSPDPEKSGAYSWLKAPRYNGNAMEVGPLARMLVAYASNTNPKVNALIDTSLKQIGRPPEALISVMGRHAARALECKLIADRCAEWVDQLVPDQPACTRFTIPQSGSGVGLTEAPRGALGHWLNIDDWKIANYQCVVPTTWNCSPRDDDGMPGPVEQALVGTPVADSLNPLEASRVVRSFDPCIACAVH